jgi:hypothetical protein
MLFMLLCSVTAHAGLSELAVSQLYVSIFNRASEGEGNQYWRTLKLDMATTADVMLETDAAKQYFGASLHSNQAFIEHIYLNTLNKTLSDDPDGIAHWIGLLDSGMTRGQVVSSLVSVINDYAPDGAYYDPDDAVTAAAYNQFLNRVVISSYMAYTVQNTPVDWETSTSFSHGLTVTDASETILDAMDQIDAIAGRELGGLTITDYFPESGPAGSYLLLKLAAPVSDLGTDFMVLYNQDVLDKNTIIKTGEDTLQVKIPADAESGDIQIVCGSSLSNAVPFSVTTPVTTTLLSQSVSPTADDQVINYNDDILITLPPDILDTTRILSISKVEGAPMNAAAPFAPASAFDVSIEGMDQLTDYVEITVKYDPQTLNQDYPAADQLTAMRWDETEQSWLPLPYQVNSESQSLSIYTDHLSTFVWSVITSVAGGIDTILEENILNDVYITPEGNFRFLYSKSAISGHTNLNDATWERITYKNPVYPVAAYQAEHPKFIQDVGKLFETALQSYAGVNGFKDPITKPGKFWGTSRHPITVKVDSWWVQFAGDPNYEKLFENIHLPTLYLNNFDPPGYFAYGTIGHELFHRIQAEYYGILGFKVYLWWIEAAAEYAGFRAAWPGNRSDGHLNGIKADFFNYPLNHTGIPSGWGEREYQYAASVFIRFLVETKGLDFREMVEFVAQGDPLSRLNEFVLSNHSVSLKDYYAEFAAWAVFSENGFMEKLGFSAADIAGQEGKDSFSIPEDDTLTIEVAAESEDMFVNVYITEENKRFPGDSTPSLQSTLKNGDSLDMPVNNLGQSKVLYLLAVTGKENSIVLEDPYNDIINNIPLTGLTVTIKNKNTTPVEQINRSFTLEGNYLAKLWGVNLEVQPDEPEPDDQEDLVIEFEDKKGYNIRLSLKDVGEETHEWVTKTEYSRSFDVFEVTLPQFPAGYHIGPVPVKVEVLDSGIATWYMKASHSLSDGYGMATPNDEGYYGFQSDYYYLIKIFPENESQSGSLTYIHIKAPSRQ